MNTKISRFSRLGAAVAMTSTLAAGIFVAPAPAQADSQGTWTGVAIAGALLGGYGLVKHNGTDAVVGGAAALIGLSQLGHSSNNWDQRNRASAYQSSQYNGQYADRRGNSPQYGGRFTSGREGDDRAQQPFQGAERDDNRGNGDTRFANDNNARDARSRGR